VIPEYSRKLKKKLLSGYDNGMMDERNSIRVSFGEGLHDVGNKYPCVGFSALGFLLMVIMSLVLLVIAVVVASHDNSSVRHHSTLLFSSGKTNCIITLVKKTHEKKYLYSSIQVLLSVVAFML
jgi:hypothetical protein